MTTAPAILFANERTAARMLDMSAAEFLALVDCGALPKPRRIAEFERWDMRDLASIIRGDASLPEDQCLDL